jgi:toxin ParE1/3/4
MRLDVRPGAQAEIEDAAAWYDGERSGLGLEFIAALDHAFDDLLSAADQNPIWMAGKPYRSVLLRRFPYMVLYRVEPDRVVIVAVAHVKRSPGYWLGREPG